MYLIDSFYFVSIYQLLALTTSTRALPADGYDGSHTFDRTTELSDLPFDGLWSDDPSYSFWDAGGPDNPFDMYEDDSTTQVDLSDERTVESIDTSTPSNNHWFQGENVRPKRERKGQYYMRKELGFARVRLNLPKMTWDHWCSLLDSGDSLALQIKKDFGEKCEWDCKYHQLTRKLKKAPNHPYLLQQLNQMRMIEHNRYEEDSALGERPLMSKTRRDRLRRYIKKVADDVQDYHDQKHFKTVRSTATEREREKKQIAEGKRVINPRYAAGDAIADEIVEKLQQFRLLLRRSPMNESVWGDLWHEINEWLQQNQPEYSPLAKPIEKSHSKIDGPSGHIFDEDKFDGGEDEQLNWKAYFTDDLGGLL